MYPIYQLTRPQANETCSTSSFFRGKFDSLLVDYVHPRKFPKLGPTLTWVLRVTTVGVLVGVYQFNTEDIGPHTRSYPLQSIADPNSFGL